jgi:5'-deoxynucleotidase YfbR-like HD superfamily hydrolase
MEIPRNPERSYELRFAKYAPEVWDALGKLERTGWVNRKVDNPETVQEHIVDLIDIARSLENLSDEEMDSLLDMLEVHDWPEAIHGDEVILSNNPEELAALKAKKFENEKQALRTICEPLGDVGQEIMSLWLRFETSSDPAASLARQIDKFAPIKKAFEYEKRQGVQLFLVFLEYARDKITHPELVKRLESLESEYHELMK